MNVFIANLLIYYDYFALGNYEWPTYTIISAHEVERADILILNININIS